VLLQEAAGWRPLDDPAEVVGIHDRTRPVIVELPLAAGQMVVAYTDGILHAGARRGQLVDPLAVIGELVCQPNCSAQALADGLLAAALAADDGRPGDDVTVAVVQVAERPDGEELEVRRMAVTFPVPPI
jgi:serine phosphatase RsbU (regulator of sigma subunit)